MERGDVTKILFFRTVKIRLLGSFGMVDCVFFSDSERARTFWNKLDRGGYGNEVENDRGGRGVKRITKHRYDGRNGEEVTRFDRTESRKRVK